MGHDRNRLQGQAHVLRVRAAGRPEDTPRKMPEEAPQIQDGATSGERRDEPNYFVGVVVCFTNIVCFSLQFLPKACRCMCL